MCGGSEPGREGRERDTESHPSLPPPGGACCMRTAPSRTPGPDGFVSLPAISYFGTERTRADMLRTLVGPGLSPARGQAVCVHNLQQRLPERRRVRSRCGHSAPISLGVSGAQGFPFHTCTMCSAFDAGSSLSQLLNHGEAYGWENMKTRPRTERKDRNSSPNV